jgi:hypothetical protein
VLPKGDFPLTRIDQIIDSATTSEMMALLDCFSGYHQIWLRTEDEEKTSFITLFGTYCYLRMPEGLCNAGPTFYRMMNAALEDQVGRNVLSYVDDIVVVRKTKENYIADLAETFANTREAKLKLNPEKCVFRITKRKVLRCLVSMKGIKANPDKIRAATQMQPPQRRKDVQKLTGQIASLNWFISKLAECSLPFDFNVEYIDRKKNIEADELAKVATRNTPLPNDVFQQIISDASIKTIEPEPRAINVIQGKDWQVPIMVYLRHYYETNTIANNVRGVGRSMWRSYRSQSISHQSFAAGFLLASNERQCSEASVYL